MTGFELALPGRLDRLNSTRSRRRRRRSPGMTLPYCLRQRAVGKTFNIMLPAPAEEAGLVKARSMLTPRPLPKAILPEPSAMPPRPCPEPRGLGPIA